MCDELDIPRDKFPADSKVKFGCNKDKSNCIAFIAEKKISNKDGNIELDYEMKTHIQSLKAMLFDSTLVFGGLYSSEGDDRATLNWESK